MPASPFPGLGERKGEWWGQVGGAGRRNGGAREEGKETAVGKLQATGNGHTCILVSWEAILSKVPQGDIRLRATRS